MQENNRVAARLTNIIKHNREVFSYEFQSESIKPWQAGDSSKLFLLLEDKEVGKKFSYATVTEENKILFTTRVKEEKSPYKEQLNALRVGSVIEITQPEGDFSLKREDRPIIMLSNGVGIAAVRSLVKSYELNQSLIPEIVQINADRSGEIYKSELDQMMLTLPFTSYFTKHRDEFYISLDAQLNRLKERYDKKPYLYIVGSNDFIMGCSGHLMNNGIPEEDIITDSHISTDMPDCTCGKQEFCGCSHDPVDVMDLTGKIVFPVI